MLYEFMMSDSIGPDIIRAFPAILVLYYLQQLDESLLRELREKKTSYFMHFALNVFTSTFQRHSSSS